MFHFLEKIQVQLHRLCPSSTKKGKILPNMLHFILPSNPGLLVEHLIQKSSGPCQTSKSYMFLKRSTSHHPINCYPQQSPYCFCTPQAMWERAVFAWWPKYNQFCITVLLPRQPFFHIFYSVQLLPKIPTSSLSCACYAAQNWGVIGRI